MTEASNQSTEIAVIQSRCAADPQINLDQALDRIGEAAGRGAKIVCLQELFTTLYPCQEECHARFEWAESIPGPSTEALCETAARHEVVIVAGLFERRTAGVFHNTAVVVDADGTLAGRYRKMHIPDDPHYYEKFYFTPGDLGFAAFDTRYGRIGVCICWDQWFPEAARLTALHGAELIVYPTAIGWLAEDKPKWGSSQVAAWQIMMRSHAIANGVFVAAPNRVGVEQHIEFWGNSLIADPYGNLIAEAGDQAEESIQAVVDWSLIQAARTHWPFLRDRRIDAYAELDRRMID